MFAALNFWEAGYDGEVRLGCGLIYIARAGGVSHFVYFSVASADRDTASKRKEREPNGSIALVLLIFFGVVANAMVPRQLLRH